MNATERRDHIRAMLADLGLPGALEAVDEILSEELTALLAKAAREMNLVAGTSERRERRHISVDDWRHDVG